MSIDIHGHGTTAPARLKAWRDAPSPFATGGREAPDPASRRIGHDGLLHDGLLHDGLLHDGLLHDGLLHDGLFLDGVECPFAAHSASRSTARAFDAHH